MRYDSLKQFVDYLMWKRFEKVLAYRRYGLFRLLILYEDVWLANPVAIKDASFDFVHELVQARPEFCPIFYQIVVSFPNFVVKKKSYLLDELVVIDSQYLWKTNRSHFSLSRQGILPPLLSIVSKFLGTSSLFQLQ